MTIREIPQSNFVDVINNVNNLGFEQTKQLKIHSLEIEILISGFP